MKRFIVAVVMLAFALPAAAQFYAGGSVGQATVKDFCEGASSAGISCRDKATAWKAIGGYQVSQYLAAEVGYTDLGKVSLSLGSNTISAKASAFEAVGVGMVPIAGRFAAYGKAGFYRAKTEASSNFGFSASASNSDLTYGAGLLVNFTPRLALRGEWQRYKSVGGGDDIGKSDIDVVSAGLLFKF